MDYQDRIEEFELDSVWSLSQYADVHDPPSASTDGGEFLSTVRDAWLERAETAFSTECASNLRPGEWEAAMDEAMHEQVDGLSFLIYTATKWRVFTDLQLWHEEPELGGETMDDMATGVVFQVGERLWNELTREAAEAMRADVERIEEVRDEAWQRLRDLGQDHLADVVGEWIDRRVMEVIDAEVDPVAYILALHGVAEEEDE